MLTKIVQRARTPVFTSIQHLSHQLSTLSRRNELLADGILSGDRRSLSRAITLVESQLSSHQDQAQLLLDHVLDQRRLRARTGSSTASSLDNSSGASAGAGAGAGAGSGAGGAAATTSTNYLTSFRLGIAGPPGAGKSTFIESLGLKLTSEGHRVAVIAIDPSSSRTGGSILGDKTRMTMLSRDAKAFVRPAATWGTLGGLAQYTNDVVLLCEACGYDIVLVETVGLGQSEVAVDDAVDMCMLLLPPATGDDLQGVKKGIMEVADMVVINKADGEFATAAKHAASSVRQALQLSRQKTKHWKAKVLRCSALTGDGVSEAWDTVREYRDVMSNTYTDESSDKSELVRKRAKQSKEWMLRQFQFRVLKELKNNQVISELGQNLEKDLIAGHVTPRAAAGKLFEEFRGQRR